MNKGLEKFRVTKVGAAAALIAPADCLLWNMLAGAPRRMAGRSGAKRDTSACPLNLTRTQHTLPPNTPPTPPTQVVKERPVLICEVEVLPDEDDATPETAALAAEVSEMFRNVLRLYRKMRRRGPAGGAAGAPMGGGATGAEPEEEQEEPEELTEYSPTQVGGWGRGEGLVLGAVGGGWAAGPSVVAIVT